LGTRLLGERARRQARGTGVGESSEQAELEAEMDEPGAIEAAETGDQVVESVIDRHAPIVARVRNPVQPIDGAPCSG
jgi:hypothetical protein